MLDHVSIGVSDIERSKAFYDQALKPLGIERLYAEDGFGYGQDRKAFFWIGLREAVRQRRPALDSFDIVLRLRIPCSPTTLPSLLREASELLGTLTDASDR